MIRRSGSGGKESITPTRREFIVGAAAAIAAEKIASANANAESRLVRNGDRVEIHSKWFAFRLDLSDGLRALSWENKITGRNLNLGGGQEVELILTDSVGVVRDQQIAVGKWCKSVGVAQSGG